MFSARGDGHFGFRPHARQLGVQLLARLPLGGLARFGDSGFAHRFSRAGFGNRGLAHRFGFGLHACQVGGDRFARLSFCGGARLGDGRLSNRFGVERRLHHFARAPGPGVVACAIERRAEVEDVSLVDRTPAMATPRLPRSRRTSN